MNNLYIKAKGVWSRRRRIAKSHSLHALFVCSFFPFLALLESCGCRQVAVENETIHYAYHDRHHLDSVYIVDTVRIASEGDTVFVDRIRYRDRLREQCDTVLRCDTVRIVQEVPQRASRRPRSPSVGFYGFLLLLGALLGWQLRRKL